SQEADEGIAQIFFAVRDQLSRPSWVAIAAGSEETKALWRQWERLRIFRGYLVRRFERPEGCLLCLQIIIPKNKREEFINLVHCGVNGGHLGRRRTQRQVQLRAYWPGWSEDVRRVLRRCTPCARY